MAREFTQSGGPAFADIAAYNLNAIPNVAFSIATVASIQRIKATGAGTNLISPGATSGTGSFRWYSQKEVRVSGTLPANYEEIYLAFTNVPDTAGVSFWIVRQTDSTYKIRMKNKVFLGALQTIGTSTNSFNTDQDYTLRIESNGTTVKVWVNDNLEIDTDNNYAAIALAYFFEPNDSNVTFYWSNWMGNTSNSESDRPGVDIEIKGIVPGAEGAVIQYGGEAGAGEDCEDIAKGLYTNWDEWSGGAAANNGDTDYNCLLGGNAGKELSDLGSVAIDTNLVIGGVMTRCMGRTNVAGKTVETHTVLRDDGGTESEIENINLGNDQVPYFGEIQVFKVPPDSGSWNDFVDSGTFNAGAATDAPLELGVRSPDSNEANDYWTAIGLEVCSIDDDPPPVTFKPQTIFYIFLLLLLNSFLYGILGKDYGF